MSLRAALFVACVVGLAVVVLVGGTWSDRLSDHAGFYLVPVSDSVAPAARAALAPRLPRRTVLVVVDGLGFEEASGMPVVATLRSRGQCRRTHVGAFTVSQPVYVVLATGLEQDRSGARNNEEPLAPLAAESIWRVARQAGLSVSGISELPWWQRLFPSQSEGFSTYVTHPEADNYFTQAPPADLMLIHPLYVDTAGHSAGAASALYRQAVERVNRELLGLLSTLDLTRDLLVLSADHGHTLSGGHGTDQPRVSHVLTCYAGPGVRPNSELGAQQATSVAPTLAVLLGLRFPRHMRAGLRDSDPDDDLDVLWQIADPTVFPPAYVADRKQAVARYRQENRSQLQRWPGSQSSWSGFYAQHQGAQHRRELVALSLWLGLLGLLARYRPRPAANAQAAVRHPPWRDSVLFAAWVFAIYGAIYLLTVILRGSFDADAINQRMPFIYFGLGLSAGVLLFASLLHFCLWRRLAALRADVLALLVLTLSLCLAHPLVFGWHLNFPIPQSAFIVLPYFAALFLFTLAVLALPLCLSWPDTFRPGVLPKAGG